jgi:hypothetical protein
MAGLSRMTASQKLINCCVAAIALVTASYPSTPHSSTIARLAFGAFCLAIHLFCFLAKATGMRRGDMKSLKATFIIKGGFFIPIPPTGLRSYPDQS